jgi:hypothetical protein
MGTEISRHDAIRGLSMQYAHGLDRREFAVAQAIFAPGCEVQGTFASGVVEDYFPRIRERVEQYGRTAHFIANVYIEDVDADRSATETYCVAYHLDPLIGGEKPWVIAVRYVDDVARGPAGWQVVRRRVDEFWQRDHI